MALAAPGNRAGSGRRVPTLCGRGGFRQPPRLRWIPGFKKITEKNGFLAPANTASNTSGKRATKRRAARDLVTKPTKGSGKRQPAPARAAGHGGICRGGNKKQQPPNSPEIGFWSGGRHSGRGRAELPRASPASGDEVQGSVESSFSVHVLPAAGGNELGSEPPRGSPSSEGIRPKITAESGIPCGFMPKRAGPTPVGPRRMHWPSQMLEFPPKRKKNEQSERGLGFFFFGRDQANRTAAADSLLRPCSGRGGHVPPAPHTLSRSASPCFPPSPEKAEASCLRPTAKPADLSFFAVLRSGITPLARAKRRQLQREAAELPPRCVIPSQKSSFYPQNRPLGTNLYFLFWDTLMA